MNVLAVDTSTTELGIGILTSDGTGYANRWREVGHSAPLFPKIEMALGETGLNLSDIELLGVVSGPGSFTGLRIGLAGVLGWGVSRGIPVQPVNTFEAVRSSIPADILPAVIVVHSRRDEFYALHLPRSTECKREEPFVATANQIAGKFPPGTKLCGPGAALFSSSVSDEPGSRLELASDECFMPDMSAVCRSAVALFSERNEKVSSFDIEPFYMTLSQAEIKFESRRKGI